MVWYAHVAARMQMCPAEFPVSLIAGGYLGLLHRPQNRNLALNTLKLERTRSSDLTSLSHTCLRDSQAGFDLGMKNGMIVAVPNPSPAAGGARVDAAIRVALSEADSRGLTGRDVTPFVLARVNEKTGGESLKSNVALVRSTTGLCG